MAYVVAIADIRELHLAQIAKVFLEREEVRERLTRMFKLAQCIDDRHARVFREFFDRVMRIRAGDNGLHPALQVLGVVADRLALADARGAVIQIHSLAAQLGHADFKTHERAERILLKQQHNRLTFQRVEILLRRGFQRRCAAEQRLDLAR